MRVDSSLPLLRPRRCSRCNVRVQGDDGAHGAAGEPGEEGEPGKDAEYCPCPQRNAAQNVQAAGYRRH